jgi:hypothetical protein
MAAARGSACSAACSSSVISWPSGPQPYKDDQLLCWAFVAVDLGLQPGSRLKTTGTLVDKLRRIPGMRLSRIQDVAGARVVAEMNREEQDRLVGGVTARFDDYRVKDRRAEPSFGYRAVHIIVKRQGRPVEIQVRTHLQDLWAQIVERLADDWGRGIRYGEPPSEPDLLAMGSLTRQQFVQGVMALAERISDAERARQLLLQTDHRLTAASVRGEEPAFAEEITQLRAEIGRLHAEIDGHERWVRELLEKLHEASTRGTLRP